MSVSESAGAVATRRPPLAHSTQHRLSESSQEYDDIEEFEDAAEDPACLMDLDTSFRDCEEAIVKFFRNDLDGAMSLMRPWSRTSLYHSLGSAIFNFIPAVLTFDRGQITVALRSIKECIALCKQTKRSYSLMETIISRPHYSSYSDEEAHAELCYAEALLLQAFTTIMDGEDMTNFIKGTLKIKSCYTTYKDCSKILEKKSWETLDSKIHFESGVRLGIAAFNLLISLLPPRLISLLEFVGFSGDKNFGLSELEAGANSPGIRSILCDLILLGYHLVICHFICAQSDLAISKAILLKNLKIFPTSIWFLLFQGRYELLQGRLEAATMIYNRAIRSHDVFPQFRHLCYWEIMWINGMLMEWREAACYASKLLDESSWSRTIYTYAKASMLLQLGDDRNVADMRNCNELMRKASHYKQRIAGKSLPMEKLVVKRCTRYETQGGHLMLPAVEMMCLWNMFPLIAKNDMETQKMLKLIESTRYSVESENPTWMSGFEADNLALVRYLHGCMLAAMGLPRMALDAFHGVFKLRQSIKEDIFLLPYTMTEMAMCVYHLGDKERALNMLQDARRKYSGYSLESRLHFRIHSRMDTIKTELKKEKENEKNKKDN